MDLEKSMVAFAAGCPVSPSSLRNLFPSTKVSIFRSRTFYRSRSIGALTQISSLTSEKKS
jgi:hypothetical protein